MKPNNRLLRGAMWGRGDIIKAALASGADPNVKHPVCVGVTPLHEVVWRSSRSALAGLRLLIEAGADINARASSGRTPLGEALDCGNIKAAEILREAGAIE